MTVPAKADIMDSVITKGDLSKLTPDERVRYYAEKFLKSIMPDDVRKVIGYGVQITRDRARRLALREIT